MITHCHTVLGVRRLTHMKAPEPRLIAWGHGSSHAEASLSLCDSGLWFCLLGQRSPGSSRHLLRDFPGYSLCRFYSYMFNFSIEMRNKHKPSRDREGSGPGRSARPWACGLRARVARGSSLTLLCGSQAIRFRVDGSRRCFWNMP